MEHIAERWSSIWCPCCEAVRRLEVDEMPADARNLTAGLDLICAECRFVVATLHDTKTTADELVAEVERWAQHGPAVG